MKFYKGDIHIHSVLSPCAELEMSPSNIILTAKEKGLDFIAVTDHNCTKQTQVTCEIGLKHGIFVLRGVEVTSKEEVHCLCFFENQETTNMFQVYIEEHQQKIPYNPKLLGYQVCVDESENIIEEIDYYLGMALNVGIDELSKTVHALNGIFIPAHINRSRYSLKSQLGFVPPDIDADAFEIFNRSNLGDFIKENTYLSGRSFIKNSDSHQLQQIGNSFSSYYIEEPSFQEFRMALARKNQRFVEIQ